MVSVSCSPYNTYYDDSPTSRYYMYTVSIDICTPDDGTPSYYQMTMQSTTVPFPDTVLRMSDFYAENPGVEAIPWVFAGTVGGVSVWTRSIDCLADQIYGPNICCRGMWALDCPSEPLFNIGILVPMALGVVGTLIGWGAAQYLFGRKK